MRFGTTGTRRTGAGASETRSPRTGRSGLSARRRAPLRIVAIVAVVAGLGAMVAADRFVGRDASSVAPRRPVGPVASAPGTGSSTWFCAGGVAGTTTSAADLRVVIANPTAEPAIGTITFVGDSGSQVSVPVSVGATGRAEFGALDYITSPQVGALVELNQGSVGVDHRLVRGSQSATAPCAPAASDTWYLPIGATTRDASTVLSVFNPFAEDALLDVQFSTESGGARPTALQGFVVPAGSMRSIDAGSYVRRRSFVSTTIRARVGRVVADEIVRFDGSGGPKGLSLLPGSASTARAWYFPGGRESTTLRERYVLYNPGAVDVEAQVDVVIDGGTIEPFVIEVPARDTALLDPGVEARIPKDVSYGIVASTSTPRGSLVVGRLLDARAARRRGIAATLGSQVVATAWIVPDAAASSTIDDRLSILNPTDTATGVSLSRLSAGATDSPVAGPVVGAQNLLVQPGGRLDIRIGDFLPLAQGSVVVRSSAAPVVVERARVAVVARAAPGPRPPYATTDATGSPTDAPGSATTLLPAVGLARFGSGVMFVQAPSTTIARVAAASAASSGPIVSVLPATTLTTLSPTATRATTTRPTTLAAVTATTETGAPLTTPPLTTPPLTTPPAATSTTRVVAAVTTPPTTSVAGVTTTVTGPTTTGSSSSTTAPTPTTTTPTPTTTRPSAVTMAIGIVTRAGLGTSASMAIPVDPAG